MKILMCCCDEYHCIDPSKIQNFYARAKQRDAVQIEVVRDLCATLSALDAPINNFTHFDTIIGCYPRVIENLFARLNQKAPQILNLRAETVDVIAEKCELPPLDPTLETTLPAFQKESDWIAWYPVIDQSRCTNCGKCVDFCVFGVYKKEEKEVSVIAPSHCKTNCPACARMCPQKAIMFPKIKEMPYNGAEIVSSDIAHDSPTEKSLTARLRARNAVKPPLFKDETP